MELKSRSAAINQSTPAIEYSLLTDSLAPFSILMTSAANLKRLKVQFHQVLFVICQVEGMGLDHIQELLSGRRSSRLVLVVSDLVSDLEVLVFSVVGLTGPNLRLG